MEAAVPAEEGGVGEEAPPGLADEGVTEEAPRLFRREAEQDLCDDVFDELRRRRRWHGGAMAVALVSGEARTWAGIIGVLGPMRHTNDTTMRGKREKTNDARRRRSMEGRQLLIVGGVPLASPASPGGGGGGCGSRRRR